MKKPSPRAVAAKLVGLETDLYVPNNAESFCYCPYCGLEYAPTNEEIEDSAYQCECGAPVFLRNHVSFNATSSGFMEDF